MFGRYSALAALTLAAAPRLGGFGLGPSGASKSSPEPGTISISRRRVVLPRPMRLRFVDRTRYPGHVLREIRSSVKRQARECARRRRQLGLSA